jgi:hypothetical protein
VSAALLLLAGVSLHFASDEILPRLVPGFPARAEWVGQLLGTGWLAVATLNWFSRSTLLGGIYGRAVVMTNTVLYFISTMVVIKALSRSDHPVALWVVLVPSAAMAAVYAWLLLKGPFTRDLEIARGS